ncbi:MAG: secretin N-terminal domain-containing protein [Terracidiphilus sp.]|jgi:type II secretory pathway component GspD/PulD (secretin)
MGSNRSAAGRRVLIAATALTLACVLMPSKAGAQASPEATKPCDVKATPPAPEVVQTFFLTNASEPNDLNDIETDLRNALPRARFYAVQSQNAITVRGTQEDVDTAQKIIAELDKPRKVYRLTYTFADIDDGKQAGSRKYVIIAVWGERSAFKQGSRVPIVTGATDGQKESTQVQYQDIGLSIEATVSGSGDTLLLRSKVEQSSLGEEKTMTTAQDPVARQSVLQESTELAQGKAAVIGRLDVPGATQHEEIEVVAELVH